MPDGIYLATPGRFTQLSPLAHLHHEPASGKEERMLNFATDIAAASTHQRYRLGAAIFQRGRLVAQCPNRLKTHPFQRRFNTLTTNIHAEVGAILAARNTDIRGATIAVSRITWAGNRACSYPCPACRDALMESGIKRVVCFDEDGDAASLNLSCD